MKILVNYSLKFIFLFIVLNIKYGILTAQIDNSYYFDDAGISKSKNIIKTDIISLIHGDFPIIYERAVTDKIGIETGIGILLPYYVHDFLPLIFNGAPAFTNSKFGYRVSFNTKFYSDTSLEKKYIEVLLKLRHFENLILIDHSIGFGKQIIIKDRLAFDVSLGIDLRFQESLDDNTYLYNKLSPLTLIFPLIIELGYLFN